MTLGHLTPEDDIFEDEDVLRDTGEAGTEYEPDRLLKRSDTLNEYLHGFKEVIKGKRPRNIFVYGRTGVGKTVGTKLVLNRLCEDAAKQDHINVRTVHLECKDLNTSYQVAAHLVNKFRDKDDQIKTTGYPEGMIYEMLWEHLEDSDATHVLIALDEVDQIGEDDTILYKLPRCNDGEQPNVAPSKTKVGIVGITNDVTFRDQLDARVQNSLCDKDIHFPPYEPAELRAILRDYSTEAFHATEAVKNNHDDPAAFTSEVLSDDVIPLVAALIAQRSGSARTALDLLYHAGDLARQRGETMVEESHVRDGEDRLQEGKIRSEVQNLPTHAKLALYTILKKAQRSELPAKSDAIYSDYKSNVKEMGSEAVTDRMIRQILSELVANGFVSPNSHNQGSNGGSFYTYAMGDVKEETLWDALADDDDSRLTDLTGFPSQYVSVSTGEPRQTTLGD